MPVRPHNLAPMCRFCFSGPVGSSLQKTRKKKTKNKKQAKNEMLSTYWKKKKQEQKEEQKQKKANKNDIVEHTNHICRNWLGAFFAAGDGNKSAMTKGWENCERAQKQTES